MKPEVWGIFSTLQNANTSINKDFASDVEAMFFVTAR